MGDKLLVGKIVNTHGLKGHLKIFPYTTDKEEFESFKYLIIEGIDGKVAVESVRYQKNMVVVLLEGYDNINAVEKLKNKEVQILREDLGEMDENSFIYSEVVGYEVIDSERGKVGVIESVQSGAAHELIVVEKEDGTTFMIPSVKAFVLGFDHANKTLRVTLIEGMM